MGKKEETDRCETGIPGFDSLCDGGLLRDSLNLIVGNAGAGKTTFLLQFLYNGANQFNENGLYVTFEEDPVELKRAGKLQGMDFDALIKSKKVEIVKFDPTKGVREIQKSIFKKITDGDVKRICFDPINVLSLGLSKDINIRKQLYDFLVLLKRLEICVLIAGESDSEDGTLQTISEEISFSKYLTDGFIELFSSGIGGGSGDRALRIKKMRKTAHFRGPVEMEITSKGIKVGKR